jgi:hypothetical protein
MKKKGTLSFSGVLYCDTFMRGKGRQGENEVEGGVEEVIRYIYYLPFLKEDLPQENSIYIYIYMYISKFVFKFSAVSLKHTSQITFVCWYSVMISLASQRCVC